MNRLFTVFSLLFFPIFFSCIQEEQQIEEQQIRVESVSISQSAVSLEVGFTVQLTASVYPSSATNKEVVWSSANSSVASVSSSGLVTAVGEGAAIITASADGKKGECTVSVVKKTIAVSEIKLDKTELTLYEGDEVILTASVLPEEATDKTIVWTTSDKSVLSVESGKVEALGKGKATITASVGGMSASCTVDVLRPVSGISLNKTDLELPLEKSETLIASILPSDATPREDIKWSSSNTDVATVDGGKVTAVGMGSTTISVSLEGYTAECNVNVKGMEYGRVAIIDLKPVDILPIIGQVNEGDKQAYDHIDHLRLAEATRIRDMMWEYGAGVHTKEQYQQLMGRLNTGMIDEYPSGYENFEIIGGSCPVGDNNVHAHAEWSILNSLLNHSNLKVVGTQGEQWQEKLDQFIKDNPQSLLVFGCSSFWEGDKETFSRMSLYRAVRELCTTGKIIIFSANGNIKRRSGMTINKTFHRDCDGDGQGYYTLASNANGKNDPVASSSLLVTVGTNAAGDSDQTGEITSSSRFPVGFHDRALFAGRAFPMHILTDGSVSAEGGNSNHGKYATSYVNYVNTAMMSICFQMYAEAKDVYELLDMVRATCLTDYIRLDGQTQPLQLINPAGLYRKYLTPHDLPTAVSSGETIHLGKGYYKGVLFSIPGAEVRINGEWIAFDNRNKSVIFSQNPMTLEWRINGDLLRRYGYTSGQTVEGQVITVDDNWGGLRLEMPLSIIMK